MVGFLSLTNLQFYPVSFFCTRLMLSPKKKGGGGEKKKNKPPGPRVLSTWPRLRPPPKPALSKRALRRPKRNAAAFHDDPLHGRAEPRGLARQVPQRLASAGLEAARRCHRAVLGDLPPFFPGILLSREPPKTLGKWLFFEKNDG